MNSCLSFNALALLRTLIRVLWSGGLQAQFEQGASSISLQVSQFCLLPYPGLILWQRVSYRPHIAHHAIHSKRENLYPRISIRSIQMHLDWIGLLHTIFSELITEENNQFGTGYVYFHRRHQLLRNLRDSQWNPGTIGKKEHCQQECTMMAFMGSIFITKAHKKAGLGQYIKRN